MTAEAFVAAAYIAGVVEGGSILLSRKKQESSSNGVGGGGSILVSSLLYGIPALPLSFIGASPGSALLNHLPAYCNNDTADDKISSGAQASIDLDKSDDSLSQNQHNTRENDAIIEDKVENSVGVSAVDKRTEMIQRAREENRRKLSAAGTRQRVRIQKQPTNTNFLNQKSMLYKYVSTLDAKPLPTPLAEGMRRTRALLMGAGLVAFVLNKQQETKVSNESDDERVSSPPSNPGRDTKAVLELFAKKQPQQGLAMRITTNPCIQVPEGTLPLVVVGATNKINLESSTYKNDGGLVYWNLGHTVLDYKSLPLTHKWWFYNDDNNSKHQAGSDGHPPQSSSSPSALLLLEARLSAAAAGMSLDSVRTTCRIIQQVAKEKGIAGANHQVLSVLVGSDHQPLNLHQEKNEVFIHEDVAVLPALCAWANQTWLIQRDLLKEEDETTNDSSSSSSGSGGLIITFIESIGGKIRQAGVVTLEALTRVFLNNYGGRVLHFYSDNVEMYWMLQSKMPCWKIVLHDTRHGSIDIRNNARCGISIVYCSTDDMCINVVSSLVSNNNNDNDDDAEASSRVLAIVNEPESANTLDWLVQDQNATLHTMSRDEICNVLVFGQARRLLKNGTPAENLQREMEDSLEKSCKFY